MSQKNYPIWHHRAMIPRYVKATKKDIEKSKYRQTGIRSCCTGTTNTGGIQKLDNPLKRIWDLVNNGTQIQWPIGLTVITLGLTVAN